MIFCNYLCITSEPLREHARFSFHSATLLWELGMGQVFWRMSWLQRKNLDVWWPRSSR